MNQWVEGTLFDNIDKFANSLGYENAGVILPLAMIPWQSTEDRDSFIRAITNKDPLGGDSHSLSYVNAKGGTK